MLDCDKNPQLKKGMHGVLANLISVNKEYELAIEMCLGQALQNVVTETEEDAKKLVEHLRNNNLGRASFLPISSIRGKRIENVISNGMKGVIGIASDLVKCDKKYTQIVLNLLGRTVVVEDMNIGISLAKMNNYSFRIVTLKGDVISSSGSITGGSVATKTVNILGRSREIEELEKEKNLLKLKNKYHDILGQNLSILQQYLNKENITQENFEEIKFMIQKMFIDIEDTDDTNANLENLIKIHKKNGTDIIIDGKLPQNKETAKVFFEIIREATTNAIRHAGSSKVFVNIKETLEETYMIITNDGRKSNEFITENQGIKDMRRKVKKLGGMFYISTVPEFSVNISIKNNC